ncbi:hypothetical protein BG74_08485 [Sodalis-like endosymbiont of Proechinophthirus fluctus]|nr:hypothetical protein BG74_08485 [Sodalis-like endosymbiont of Proechinophthirus fluctus]
MYPVVVAIALVRAALLLVAGPESRIAYSLVVTTTVLSPVVATTGIVLSSITVVSNANQLIRFKPVSAVDASARTRRRQIPNRPSVA